MPALLLMEPDLIIEVLNDIFNYRRPPGNPLTKLLAAGVGAYETDKWAKHRKIINPAFHLEKLKVISSSTHHSGANECY